MQLPVDVRASFWSLSIAGCLVLKPFERVCELIRGWARSESGNAQ